jgi:hypothetical protein
LNNKSESLVQQVNECRSRVTQLTAGLTPEQLTRRPEPAKWSIAECLAHLNLAAAAIQPKVARAIEQGRKDNVTGDGPFSPGPLGRLLIWIAEPPPKFRMRAPKGIAPSVAQNDPAQVAAEFMRFQDGWEKLVRDSEGLDQNKLRTASPFPGLPRLRLAAPIPWMLAHQRRHLLQAENVKRQIDSAASGHSSGV